MVTAAVGGVVRRAQHGGRRGGRRDDRDGVDDGRGRVGARTAGVGRTEFERGVARSKPIQRDRGTGRALHGTATDLVVVAGGAADADPRDRDAVNRGVVGRVEGRGRRRGRRDDRNGVDDGRGRVGARSAGVGRTELEGGVARGKPVKRDRGAGRALHGTATDLVVVAGGAADRSPRDRDAVDRGVVGRVEGRGRRCGRRDDRSWRP